MNAQKVMNAIINDVGQPFYDKEAMMETAAGIKKIEGLLDQYRRVQDHMAKGAAQEYKVIDDILRQVETEVKTLDVPEEGVTKKEYRRSLRSRRRER